MNKIGTLDIVKAYLGNKELTANNAYIGEISLIKGSGPAPVPIPNDEIWYTSSDGNVVEPHRAGSLPTIVSNTYVDGKGVIKFANDVTSIGVDAFMDCISLTSVTIPNSVTSIGYRALQGCSSLTSVTIPNSVASIGNSAFNSCTSLTSVTIGNSVTSIGSGVFTKCSSLTSINVDSSNPNYSSADGVLFNKDKTSLIRYPIGNTRSEYIIPNSVSSIENAAFVGCDSLTSITIPTSVTSIGDGAFGQISAKILFSKLYSSYTDMIFSLLLLTDGITCNVEFNISEIPTDYNISSMLPQVTSNDTKGTLTYNIYTDYAPCKDQALALANTKTIVNVYHIDGTPWT